MNEFPIDIYFYPKYTGGNPYIRSLGEAIKNVNPMARVFYDELYEFRFYPQPHWGARRSIIHLQWIPEFFLLQYRRNSILSHIRRNAPYLMRIKHFFFMQKLKKKYGTRLIHTIHDLNSGHMRPTWTRFFTDWASRLSDAYIIHCKKSAEDFFGAETEKSFFVIPHANFIGYYGPLIKNRAEAKSVIGISEDAPLFLVFGWMRKETKNLEWLLSTLKNIQDDKLRFVFAGHPIDIQNQTYIGQYSKDERFLFIPRYIPDEQIRWLMSASDFLINAQVRGYVSGVTVTALSCGLPVISIKWGCAPTFVKDGVNGFLFSQEPGGLESAVERAIQTLNNPPAYRQMRLMALKSIQIFSQEMIAKKTLEAYYQILK